MLDLDHIDRLVIDGRALRDALIQPAAATLKSAGPSAAVALLQRIAAGASRAERARVEALGYEAYIEEQLAPEALDDAPLEAVIAQNLPSIRMSRAELYAMVRANNGAFGQIAGELVVAKLLRSLYSRRQLFEAMVEFWSDVLNIQVNSAQLVVQKVIDDREVPRVHALGRFRDLLGASARSPAMLLYLDNASNGREGINENYARELMELHTLGVDGGYTEADVVDVARALSGWSVNQMSGEFLFRPTWHDAGAKRVLGVDIAAGGGQQDGEQVLDILAAHPSTARHIATRLIRRFVSDRPSATLVAELAAAFSSSDGDIRTLLRALFLHPEVRQAPAAKLKRPQEFVLSVLRVLEATPAANGIRVMLEALNSLAHVPFQWPAPNGYPDSTPYWLNSNAMLKRWNYAIDTARGGQRGGWTVPWDALLAGVETHQQLVERSADIVGIAPLSSASAGLWLKSLLTLAAGQPLTPATRNGTAATLAALMLGSEAFQLR
jgi:uncharacterized protein (DUF1800 family)